VLASFRFLHPVCNEVIALQLRVRRFRSMGKKIIESLYAMDRLRQICLPPLFVKLSQIPASPWQISLSDTVMERLQVQPPLHTGPA